LRHIPDGSFFSTSLQTLYAGTVRLNILLGAIKPHSEVTQQEIEQACRNANILEFINSLPEFVVSSCLSDDWLISMPNFQWF
jgi:ABC-type multidrug transport system fused ATPase/permease subunit